MMLFSRSNVFKHLEKLVSLLFFCMVPPYLRKNTVEFSNKERVICGVSQGSFLGPLLFLLYISNDIQASSKKIDLFLFAEDTNLLFADKSLKSLETVVNKELKHV